MSINKKLTVFFVSIVILMLHLSLPLLEFNYNGKLFMFSYKPSHGELDEEYEYHCYNENVTYNEKRDISIIKFSDEKSLFGFYKSTFEYEKGNLCDSEFILEESYINHFIEDAIIDEYSDDVDIGELIKDKKAVLVNKRYPWNDEHKYISYELDGKHQEMFIYTNDEGLLIIQVGLGDEAPKFIAYK